MKRRLLQASLALLPAVFPNPCSAAALGEVISQSGIGAPFRAEIRLLGYDPDDSECLRLSSKSGGNDGIQVIRLGDLVVERGRLIVTSSQRGEMVASFTIQNICNGLSRKYTLLLSPPPELSVATTPARQASPVRKAERSQAASASTPSPSRSVTWIAADGESLSDMAEALYPNDRRARNRFVRDAIAANPALFAGQEDADKPLPAGTSLQVPTQKPARKQATTRPAITETPRPGPQPSKPREEAERQESRPAPQRHPALAKQTTPSTSQNDRLVIQPGLDEASANSAQTPGATSAPQSFDERERRLLDNLNNLVAAQLQMAERLAQLENAQARLLDELDELKKREKMAMELALAKPEPVAGSSANWLQWLLVLAGAAVVAAAGLILHRNLRASSKQRPAAYGDERAPHWEPPPPATVAIAHPEDERDEVLAATSGGASADVPDSTSRAPAEMPPLSQAPRLPEAGDETDAETGDAFLIADDPEQEAEEHDSAIELAEIMLSFGRVQGAAETLADFVRANPKQAVTPWLKLLSVYRMANMRAEFESLSRQLNRTFNVKIVSWDEFDDEAHNTDETVEQMPHIIANLTQMWPSRDCQTYLDTLLRDNREGTRQGFPVAVVDELLMLSGVLNLLLGARRGERS